MDYGLLAGLGEGLKQGVAGFKTQQDYIQKKRQAAQEQQMKQQLMDQQQAHQGDQMDMMAAKERLVKDPNAGYVPSAGLLESQKIEDRLKESQINKNLREKEVDPLQQELKSGRLAEVQAKREKSEFDKTPKGRLEKSGGETKQKVGFITSALENLTKYEDNFRKGERQDRLTPQTPFIGGFISSTPIDEARVSLEEAIGRLASGGAIGSGEEARFRQMVPTAADSDEDAVRKISNLRAEMENKITGYGFKTDELEGMGFDPKSLGYNTEFSKAPGRGLIKTEPKAPAPTPSPQEIAAEMARRGLKVN